jgi:putative N6-adenine-specific DNA methylase
MSHAHEYYAVTPPGLEAVAAAELGELAAHDIVPDRGGVAFAGSEDLMARVNLRARTLTRVLMRLDAFKALSFPELYNKCRRSDWSRFLLPGAPVSVQAACHASRLMHSGRVAETVLAAIADRLGTPPADRAAGSQQVFVRIDRDRVTLSLDTSGERLDRRGYRLHPGHAPLRETIAAALLRWAEWDGQSALMVPMCGSGTLAIEAAWIAMHRAPNLDHAFPFPAWPSLSARRWQRALDKARAMQRPATAPILASDIDPTVLAAAMENAVRAGVQEAIGFSVADALSLEPAADTGLIVLNPPYGQRLGRDVRALYRDLGGVLTSRFGGWRRIVLVPDAACEHALGMAVRRRLGFRHGGRRITALELAST